MENPGPFFFSSSFLDCFVGANNWEKLEALLTIHLIPDPGSLFQPNNGDHGPRAMNTRSLNVFNMDSVLLLPLPALGGQGFQRRPAPPNSIWKVQNVPPIPGWKAWPGSLFGHRESSEKLETQLTFCPCPPIFP